MNRLLPSAVLFLAAALTFLAAAPALACDCPFEPEATLKSTLDAAIAREADPALLEIEVIELGLVPDGEGGQSEQMRALVRGVRRKSKAAPPHLAGQAVRVARTCNRLASRFRAGARYLVIVERHYADPSLFQVPLCGVSSQEIK